MSLVSKLSDLTMRLSTEFNMLRTEVASAIAGKADASHGHTVSDVTNLQSNLDAKANLSGATFSGLIIGKPNNGGTIINSNDTGALSVRSATSGDSAAMSFHRPGLYAINMGLDTDNGFKIGGWSAGNARLTINSTGNTTVISPTAAGSYGVRNTTISTAAPSGGVDGDVWLRYS
jgi:hypothetical protein